VCSGCLLRRSRLLEKTLTNLLSLFLNLNPACWPCCLDPPPTSRPSAPATPPVPQRTQAVRPPTASALRTLRRSPPPALVKTPLRLRLKAPFIITAGTQYSLSQRLMVTDSVSRFWPTTCTRRYARRRFEWLSGARCCCCCPPPCPCWSSCARR
jgi:hypothetical protein